MSQPVNAIFVYGTLQRGEQRERCWPQKPLRIEWATLRGELHDLGDYPAMIGGEDLILGELWHFAAIHIVETLATLDEIEGYRQGDNDLYTREIVTYQTLSGDGGHAYTYRHANPTEIASSPIIAPDAEGYCRWTCRRGSDG